MTPKQIEQVRQIIREELANLLGFDRFIFQKSIQIFDARNIQLGRTTGTKLGTEGGNTGQKLGFFGKTPVVQLTTISDTTGGGTAGVDTPARTTISEIIDTLQLIGLMQ